MHLELLDRFDDYQRVENIWKDLAEASNCSYFLSWGWIQNWIETLPKEVPLKLAVLTNGSGPRSAFFLGRAQMAKQGVFRSEAYLLNQTGNWAYDRLYIEHNSVLHSNQGPCSLQQIVDSLPGKWEELYLSVLAPSSFPANDLNIAPPHEVMIANVIPCPYVDLQQAREHPKGLSCFAQLEHAVAGQAHLSALREQGSGGRRSCPRRVQRLTDLRRIDHFARSLVAKAEQAGAFHSDYFRAFHRRLIENRFSAGESS